MKLVYSDPKTGRSGQMQLDADKSALLLNHKINEVIDASPFGLSGYKLKITGGSDTSGFAMHMSISGSIKTKQLKKVANSGKLKGQYQRKTVRGAMVSTDIAVVNSVVVEYGDKPAPSELFPEPVKKEKEEKKEDEAK